MREPSKISGWAAAILLLTATPSAALGGGLRPGGAAAEAVHLPATATPLPVAPTPVFLYTAGVVGSQVGCAPMGYSSRLLEWWRQTWGTGLSHRAARTEEPEQERVAGTAYYLRSPLLSGFYGRATEAAECDGGAAGGIEAEEHCALVTLRFADHRTKRIEVHLPQLDARNARQLGGAIKERLESGEAVVLVRRDRDPYHIHPGVFREVGAETCAAKKHG
jgi:hypothetical protein